MAADVIDLCTEILSPTADADRDAALVRMAMADHILGLDGKKLMGFQREAVPHLAASTRWGLFDDPGLGKTFQGILAVPDRAPILVACPAGMKFNWARDIHLLRPDYSVVVPRGHASWRWPRARQAVVCGYETLPPAQREIDRKKQEVAGLAPTTHSAEKLRRQISKLEYWRSKLTLPQPGTFMLADEAHRVRNPSTRCAMRWRELLALCLYDGGRVGIMTGTPLRKEKEELWSVLQAAGLARLAFAAKAEYEARFRQEGFVGDALRRVSIRRLRDDVLPDLPKKTRETFLVGIGAKERRVLDDLVKALRELGIDFERATIDVLSTESERGIIRERISAVRKALATSKLHALKDIVEAAEREKTRLVVACCHRAPIDWCAARPHWGRISGAESSREKQRIQNEFQAGRLRGVALTMRSGGEGITLHRAWRMIFVDLDWTPASVSQCEDRILRIGQEAQRVLYTSLVADHPLERRVDFLLRQRQDMIERTVDASAIRPEGGSRG